MSTARLESTAAARVDVALDAIELGAHVGRGLVPQLAILLEGPLDHAGQASGKGRVELCDGGCFAVQDGVEHHGGRVALEGKNSCGHLIHHRSERKDVRASVGNLSTC